MSRGRDLVFIGDVHLDGEGPDLDAFLALLDRLAQSADRIVLAGDLFDLWIGLPDMEGPHHRRVLERLAALRRAGVLVRYLEGNRDFHVGPAHAGRELDEATDRGVIEQAGPLRLFAIHGDLANRHDRQYRLWRWVARSGPVWAFFRALPRRRRGAWAQDLTTRLARTNPDYRAGFPEPEVRDYAAGILARGFDAVVLGHFHVERDLATAPPSPAGRILVLPEWRTARRHLRAAPDGTLEFVRS